MTDKLQQLTAEKEAYEIRLQQLRKQADFIKLEIKAEERKIKAVQELIDALNDNPQQS